MLEARGISKSFPGVKSLDRVDFACRGGEIMALLGENGAGKSTLMKVVAGAYAPDEGEVAFAGQARRWAGPQDAKRAGIHVIWQELVLFPELTVAENILIGREPRNRLGLIDRRSVREQARELLARLGHQLDPDRRVGELSVADQQMVEIAKALVGEVKLLILDEPTAVIAGHEVELLFERLATLRRQGVAIVYISHRLEEIFRIADRVTVLKDGRLVGVRDVPGLDQRQLVAMMVGRPLADIFPPKRRVDPMAPVVLAVRDLASGRRLRRASFELRAGEILGVAGMVGSGRTELAETIFGSRPLDGGSVAVAGTAIARPTPAASIALGLGFLTEDRKGEGLLMLLDIAANVTAPELAAVTSRGLLDRGREQALGADAIRRFGVAAPGPSTGVRTLSGGNQQKVLFGRWARSAKRVLILDEPTRGVDVGAKVEIYRLIQELAATGVAVLVISSELPEVVGLCDRVLVMRDGVVTGEVEGADVTEEGIMHLATDALETAPARAVA